MPSSESTALVLARSRFATRSLRRESLQVNRVTLAEEAMAPCICWSTSSMPMANNHKGEWVKTGKLRYLHQNEGPDQIGRSSPYVAGLPTSTEAVARLTPAEPSRLQLPSDVRQLRGYKQRLLTEQDLVKYRVECASPESIASIAVMVAASNAITDTLRRSSVGVDRQQHARGGGDVAALAGAGLRIGGEPAGSLKWVRWFRRRFGLLQIPAGVGEYSPPCDPR